MAQTAKKPTPNPSQEGNKRQSGKNTPLRPPQGGNAPKKGGYANVERLYAYLEENKENGMTQEKFAKIINRSSTTVSQYLNKVYPGNVKELDRIIGEHLDSEEQYLLHMPQIQGISLTSQSSEIIKAIEETLRDRCITIIAGAAGIGKSETLKQYWKEHPTTSILLTLCPSKRSRSAFIRYFWSQIPGMSRKDTSRAVDLKFDDIVFNLQGKTWVILIDDAQWLTLDGFEDLRSIKDQVKSISIVLVGTFSLKQIFGLGGQAIISEQLHSRVFNYCPLDAKIRKHDLADVIALYGIHDPEIINWFSRRCNRVGRRYRWICFILNRAYRECIEQKKPMSVAAVKEAAKHTNLYSEKE